MSHRFLLCSLLLGLCSCSMLIGQEPKDQVDQPVAALDAELKRAVSVLESLSDFDVEVDQVWELDGVHQRRGKNELELKAQHPGKFALVVHPDGLENQSLSCVSDGKAITRSMMQGGNQLYSQAAGSLDRLLDDVMTESSVRHSGLDLLFRSDPVRYVLGMASNVQDLGEDPLPEGPARHFGFQWGRNARQTHEIWITKAERPVLAKVVTNIEFAVEEDEPQTMTIVSKLDWHLNSQLSDDAFQPSIEADAVKVADLYGYLSEGGTLDLVGAEAPSVSLPLLQKGNWDLSQHRGNEVVLLYFYASWAAPCREQIPELVDFIASYEKHGVATYAVDVGEDMKTAAAFAETQQYTRPVVVDAESTAATAFRITTLPTVVVIDREGKIVASHVGNTPEVREIVSAELDRLLELEKKE